MTISYPLAFPTHTGVQQSRWRQRTVVAVSKSPFTAQRQVQRHPGQWWEVSITLPPMLRTDAEIWIAWLVSLNGPEGTFLMGPSDYALPLGLAGSVPGAPLVMGGSQTGASLTFDGVAANATPYLGAGSFIQLGSGSGSRLHKVLADVNSNGSGVCTADIWPRLRESPADNDPLTVSGCKGVFSLMPGAGADWSVNAARQYGLSFDAVEVV